MKVHELFEASKSQDMIVVDIQPFYHKYHARITPKLIEHINNMTGDVYWMHNGCEVGIEDTVREQKEYLLEWGMEEDVLDKIEFEEKGYAFFRGWMDTGIDEDDIIKVGKYMYKKRIYDTRDLDEDDYKKMGYDEDETEEFMEHSDNMYWPDININELKRYNNAYLVGGGKYECLEEIRIVLEIVGIKYKLLNEFIY